MALRERSSYFPPSLDFSFVCQKSMQPILKEISPEYSSEGLMLKLKLQSFGHLMQRVDSLERTLMLGKTEGRRRRGRQGMRWSDGITDSVEWFERTPGDSEGQGSLVCCRVTKSQGHDSVTEQQQRVKKELALLMTDNGMQPMKGLPVDSLRGIAMVNFTC